MVLSLHGLSLRLTEVLEATYTRRMHRGWRLWERRAGLYPGEVKPEERCLRVLPVSVVVSVLIFSLLAQVGWHLGGVHEGGGAQDTKATAILVLAGSFILCFPFPSCPYGPPGSYLAGVYMQFPLCHHLLGGWHQVYPWMLSPYLLKAIPRWFVPSGPRLVSWPP